MDKFTQIVEEICPDDHVNRSGLAEALRRYEEIHVPGWDDWSYGKRLSQKRGAFAHLVKVAKSKTLALSLTRGQRRRR